jgi:hypothetical protein|tara:strand:+ start:1580 stop:1891 length:312 start_codon:yes stop_codon:yes gene_type:complete
MKLTRESLKKLITEAIRENKSLLLEMPEDVPSEKGRHEEDQEGSMAKKELFHMSQKAQQMHDMLQDDDQLDPWVQAKITKASAMVGAVFDHLMYEMRPGHIKE